MPSDNEMISNLIDNYINLQRIKKSDDMRKEVEYQLTVARAKLEFFGIVTENLEIK